MKKIPYTIKTSIAFVKTKTNISFIIPVVIIIGTFIFGLFADLLKNETFISYFEIIIDVLFLFFVLKEFKMTRKSFEWQEEEFKMTRKSFEMTRKSFEWQEEELKNKYCHEVWYLVGWIFFHNLLFNDFSMGGGGGGLEKYKNMIKQPEKIKQLNRTTFESILEKGKITNPEGENVTKNFKEVLNKYEHIVLKIVEELSMELYYTLTKVSPNISDIDEESIFKQEEQMMKQLAEHTFISSTVFYYCRAKWGDKTILSLYKLLATINVPKCNKN